MVIKNIIFDLGGVILDIDYNLTEQAFKKLGCKNFGEIYSKAKQTTLFDDFEEGKIDEAAFFFKLKNLAALNVSINELKNAWNAMLIALPERNFELLKSLQNKYRVFLLSNTNETHVKKFVSIIDESFGFNNFAGLFEQTYYSSRIGLRKPNAECFELVLSENNLKPEETVFIDDSIQHVEGAKKTGIQAHWLDLPKHTGELLQELKLI
ncbi:MAG: HAD family hydrolase [Bacteroidia bacterium]